MKTIFPFLLVFSLTYSLYLKGQKIVSIPTAPSNWKIASVADNYNFEDIYSSYGNYEKGVIYLDENFAVFPVQYNKHDFGLAEIDRNGQTKWQIQIKGYFLSVVSQGTTINALYTPEWSSFSDETVIKTIHAITLDATIGRIISDKIVFENKSDAYISPKILLSPDKTWASILIRYSKFHGRTYFNSNSVGEKMSETVGLELLTLSPNYTVKETRKLKSVAIDNIFLGILANSSTGFTILSIRDQDLIVEKFVPDKSEPVTQFSTDADIYIKYSPEIELSFEPGNSDMVYCTLKGRNKNKDLVFRYFSFNLKTKKILQHEDLLNKSYAEMLEKQNKNDKINIRSQMRELRNDKLLVTNDNIVSVKQISSFTVGTNQGSATRFYSDEIIVSIFNKNLDNTSNTVIKKGFEVFIPSGMKPGTFVKDNKLYIFYNINSGIMKLAAEYTVIDLKTGLKIEKHTIEKDNLPNDANIEASAIIHFNDGDLLPYYISKGMFPAHDYSTSFQKIIY